MATQACVLMICTVGERLFVAACQVPEHAELQWILSCCTPLGWLQRMTQFKEKSAQVKAEMKKASSDRPSTTTAAGVGLGLLSYPVLQAADILLYRSTAVPVGEDQRQHLELTRDIAMTFNHRFCGDESAGFFPLPETLSVEGRVTRVMSLRDGTKKMSKSDASAMSRIDLLDDADTIRHKIRRAKTDSLPGFTFDPETRPERSNLMSLYAAATGASINAVASEFGERSTAEFKDALADVLIADLAPIQREVQRLLEDGSGSGDTPRSEPPRGHVDAVLRRGAEHARERAARTMQGVRRRTGLPPGT